MKRDFNTIFYIFYIFITYFFLNIYKNFGDYSKALKKIEIKNFIANNIFMIKGKIFLKIKICQLKKIKKFCFEKNAQNFWAYMSQILEKKKHIS